MGRGPEGDLRVGVNLTMEPQVGNDIPAAASVTMYAGDTSVVKDYATELSVGTPVGGATVGYTTSAPNRALPDSSSVGFLGASVGPSLQPVIAHDSKTITLAADVSKPKSLTSSVILAAINPSGEKIRSNINAFVRNPRESIGKCLELNN